MSEVTFTARQGEAIDVARRAVDACVVAGPGSGKTTVLVEYFQRLVEAGVDTPRGITPSVSQKASRKKRAQIAQQIDQRAANPPGTMRGGGSSGRGSWGRPPRQD